MSNVKETNTMSYIEHANFIYENTRYLIDHSTNIDGKMMYALWLKISDTYKTCVNEFNTFDEAKYIADLCEM